MLVAAVALAGCSAASTTSGAESSANSGAGSGAAPTELNVSAAATLKAVLTSTAPAFEKAHNVKLVFNFGASGTLLKQIEGGAPADVFASASRSQIASAISEGLASADASTTFATNELVILVPKGNPKGIRGPADLAKATKLATGDPVTAAHGAKAQEWLTGLGLWESLKPRFVFAQNAAQTDDYIARGEVDAGLGFAGDASGRGDMEIAYAVPKGEIKPIVYVVAPLKATKNASLAETYVKYLLSAEAQSAFVGAGFGPAPSK
jgi:molybdate transport system substrate-binding protein